MKPYRRFMFQLLESICLRDGVFQNLSYHEVRMKKARHDLFNSQASVNLEEFFKTCDYPSSGLFKTRLIYDTEIRKVEFVPYIKKQVRSLKLILCDTITYDYKFVDRTVLDNLYIQRGESDDILIVKNGFITDSSYANVLFKKENNWYTPERCLLRGTMREYLLEAGLIKEANITISNYLEYESVKLINSMLGQQAEEIPVKSIG